MKQWTIPALLLLGACSDSESERAPAEVADDGAATAARDVVPGENAPSSIAPPTVPDADLAYAADPAVRAPAAPDAGIGTGDRAIPAAIQGRWALKAEDCAARKGTDLTALVIDARTLRFFESAGDLVQVRDRRANRIVADYRFSGEGQEWHQMMLLGLADGGRVLVRRDYGEGADPQPLRYTRCAA